jgi:hypothetical protein
MSLHVITRVAAAAAVLATVAAGYVVTDLKGDYKVEFVVQETSYTGTAKAEPGAKSAFSGKWEFTAPSSVVMDVTGKTSGDSVSFDAKYVDNGRSCTGTLAGKGSVEKDGNKAAGTIAINDSCGGELSGTFRLWR